MKLSQSAAQSTHRVLVYGPPKTGKTKLVGELSEVYNLLWFDLENGSNTLRTLPFEQQERVDLISIADTRSYPIAIESLLKIIKGGAHKLCQAHSKVNCAVCAKSGAAYDIINLSALSPDTVVVFDSLTQLTNSAIANITKDQPDDYKLKQDDWGNLGKLMDIFLSHIQQASFNVVCISHETEAEQEDGKTKIVPTAGTRNFSRNSAKYFDHVVYCEVSAKKHKFTSMSTSNLNIVTGSRTDISLDKMSIPSLLPIFQGAAAKSGLQAQQAVVNIEKRMAQIDKIEADTALADMGKVVIPDVMKHGVDEVREAITEATGLPPAKESLFEKIQRQKREAAAKAAGG